MNGPLAVAHDPKNPAVFVDVGVGDGWICRYRIQWRRGRAVLAGIEVRRDGPLPPAGLTARQLRQVRLTTPWDLVPDLEDRAAAAAGIEKPQRSRFGLDALDPKTEPLRPGRGGRSDLFLAKIAARYSGLVSDRHPRPFRQLTDELRERGFEFQEATVRGFIDAARKRRLLTAPTRSGVSEGDITPKALRLLEDDAELQLDAVEPLLVKPRRQAKRKD